MWVLQEEGEEEEEEEEGEEGEEGDVLMTSPAMSPPSGSAIYSVLKNKTIKVNTIQYKHTHLYIHIYISV